MGGKLRQRRAAEPIADLGAGEGTLALMTETLTAAGFEVVRSRDGLEALRRMRDAPPDIALLDVMMPGLDGREVCSRMRVDPALSHVPVVMVTGADERHIDWGGCGARCAEVASQRYLTPSLGAKRSNPSGRKRRNGLLRRFAPRNDGVES